MSTLASVFGYGLLSARAAASVAGRFYYATDTTLMYRDNGSTWDTLAVGTSSMATDGLWDAAGDLAVGTGANTGARLAMGAAGMAPRSNGTTIVSTYHPEDRDYCASGATPVDFSAASTGTGVSLVGTAGWNAHGRWTTSASVNYLDVASSIGTGAFDLRARIQYHPQGATLGEPFGGFFVTDSSRTLGTMLGMSRLFRWQAGGVPNIHGRTGNSNSGTTVSYIPDGMHIQRIRRTGTTYVYEVSFNEGATWFQIETGTSSLNIAKVGFWLDVNGASSVTDILIDWVRSF